MSSTQLAICASAADNAGGRVVLPRSTPFHSHKIRRDVLECSIALPQGKAVIEIRRAHTVAALKDRRHVLRARSVVRLKLVREAAVCT